MSVLRYSTRDTSGKVNRFRKKFLGFEWSIFHNRRSHTNTRTNSSFLSVTTSAEWPRNNPGHKVYDKTGEFFLVFCTLISGRNWPSSGHWPIPSSHCAHLFLAPSISLRRFSTQKNAPLHAHTHTHTYAKGETSAAAASSSSPSFLLLTPSNHQEKSFTNRKTSGKNPYRFLGGQIRVPLIFGNPRNLKTHTRGRLGKIIGRFSLSPGLTCCSRN